jgi:hypothetical protein
MQRGRKSRVMYDCLRDAFNDPANDVLQQQVGRIPARQDTTVLYLTTRDLLRACIALDVDLS